MANILAGVQQELSSYKLAIQYYVLGSGGKHLSVPILWISRAQSIVEFNSLPIRQQLGAPTQKRWNPKDSFLGQGGARENLKDCTVGAGGEQKQTRKAKGAAGPGPAAAAWRQWW